MLTQVVRTDKRTAVAGSIH